MRFSNGEKVFATFRSSDFYRDYKMSFFEAIKNFFDSIFKKSSPEFQKKAFLRKIDAEIREFKPLICKNGMLLPNFAEALSALQKNARPLDDLFSYTIHSNDLHRQQRFESQLIITGYSLEYQNIMEELEFENRKKEVLADLDREDKVYLHQKTQLEKLIRELNADNFAKMDKDILSLRQFAELCHYNFTPFLQAFDSNFLPESFSYQPSYKEIPASKALNLLEDMYFQSSGLKITTTMAEAIIALAQMRKGSELSEREKENYVGNLKKINYVVKTVFSPEKLKTLIRMCKEDLSYEPPVAKYSGSPRQEFSKLIQAKFLADEQKIRAEIQDETISGEVNALFPNIPLLDLDSYNYSFNEVLQKESSLSFRWLLPLKVLKSFLNYYFPDSTKALLNDIVIEGFFNSPDYKTSFSGVVYAAIGSNDDLKAFEDSFENGKKNSIAVLESYIKDSKKDKDFYNRLEKMVESINNDAHRVMQNIVTNLFSLYKILGELLQDAKKPSSELISNLKVLMMSSRNREYTAFLETNYGNWDIFFQIMKNYVIISSGDAGHE